MSLETQNPIRENKFSSVDEQIIREINKELQAIKNEWEAVNDIQKMHNIMTHKESEPLLKIEEKVTQAYQNVEKGTESVQQSANINSKKNRLIIWVTAGGGLGGFLGAGFFALNPIAGLTAMLIGTVAGASLGGVIDKVTE